MNELISIGNISLQPVSGEILALNEVSGKYGLVLSEEDAKELSEMRNKSLVENERVEIGVGAVAKIIERFCASRYITKENYAYILNEVTYLFYYIKTETDDKISDGDLVNELFERFELYCRGSIDTLEARETEKIIRKVNSGDKYYEWYKDRDELDYTPEQGSREAPVEYEDAGIHTARRATVSSYGEDFFGVDDVADHDMYEEDVDFNADDFTDAELDAFDEFYEHSKVLNSMDGPILNLAKEDIPDEEDEDDE